MESKDKALEQVKSAITANQQKAILERTPKEYVKFRPGASGMQFPYVETGWMISKLNETFGYLWDFKVTGEQVGKKQIWVRGELTAHLSPELSITKANYGGSPIKFFQGTEDPIDIGNDLKAASADCLKKCASMFGIASDIYWKDYDLANKKAPQPENSETKELLKEPF